jgi:putative endonuclease
MFYYTYILKSEKDGNLYIGWTNDLRVRLSKHNEGKVPATKYRRPLNLVYYEACLNRKKAILREKYFKTGFGRKFLKDRV